MFRIISSNAQLTFRPVLLLKVRSNKGTLSLPSTSNALQANNNVGGMPGYPAATPMFTRSNSASTTANNAGGMGYTNVYTPRLDEHLMYDSPSSNADAGYKLKKFQDNLRRANEFRNRKDNNPLAKFIPIMTQLIDSLEDSTLRKSFTSMDLFRYSQILSFSIFHNRTSRLSGMKNRDSDQYNSENLNDEVLLKAGVLKFADYILNGEFNSILQARTLQFAFYALSQLRVYPEMTNLWEQGALDKNVGNLYLEPRILAIILPVAYDSGRFTYEEVLEIYSQCANSRRYVGHELLSSIGKIAITAGDYSKGLDALEALLKLYEQKNNDTVKILGALSDLHLCFIGSCKDIKIAKHFFDKVVSHDLPYRVRLKVPHVESLLKNCYDLSEPIDNILYFWSSTIAHYNTEKNSHVLNSRYSILNNTLFTIFFKTYPTLNAESFEKLKYIISIYADIKPIDEFFLNTIISNYSWGEKIVLEQLIQNYSIYNVERTPVSYRISLKKTGEINDYTEKEILHKWNQSLAHLDQSGFTYIPIADWAALRDATILSQYSNDRKDFYLNVLNAYKDYIQDSRTLTRFLTHWSKKIEHFDSIKRLSIEENPHFNSNVQITVPQFVNLRRNIDFKKDSRPFMDI